MAVNKFMDLVVVTAGVIFLLVTLESSFETVVCVEKHRATASGCALVLVVVLAEKERRTNCHPGDDRSVMITIRSLLFFLFFFSKQNLSNQTQSFLLDRLQAIYFGNKYKKAAVIVKARTHVNNV